MGAESSGSADDAGLLSGGIWFLVQYGYEVQERKERSQYEVAVGEVYHRFGALPAVYLLVEELARTDCRAIHL